MNVLCQARYPSTTKTFLSLVALIGLSVIFGPATRAAEVVEIPWNPNFQGGKALKAYDHAVVAWDLSSEFRHLPQIEVFERTGQKRLALNILAAAESAASVAIWDVSAAPTGMVAAAVVFGREPCGRETVLLIYDRNGGLRSAVRLPPERSIVRLEVDADETIWALGHHPGNLNPHAVPMLFHYDRDGKAIQGVIPRSEFPADAEFTQEGPNEGGAPALGLTKQKVWFWLPASRRLTVINKDGSGLVSYSTGLPGLPATDSSTESLRTEVMKASLLPTGALLAQVVITGPASPGTSGLYAWTQSGGWQQFAHPAGQFGEGQMITATAGELVINYPSANPGIIRIRAARLP